MVIYLLCFDLSLAKEIQIEQVSYWLTFLNSSLAHSAATSSKWTVFLVGLRSDKKKEALFGQRQLSVWKHMFPTLPIYDQLFITSSVTSNESVQALLQEVKNECKRIFETHTVLIPSVYKQILHRIKAESNDEPSDVMTLYEKYNCGLDLHGFKCVLSYLNTIGQVILLHNTIVFPNPTVAAKIAANFVSPKDVREQLLRNKVAKVELLSASEIGSMLLIRNNEERYCLL